MRQRINKGIIGPQTYIGGLNTIADINLLSITGYIVTDSSYNNLDDTTVGTTGGYIKINGTGFSSGITVYINGSVVSSTYVNPGEIRAVVPTLAAGTYTIWVFKGSISAAFVSLVTSGFPSWTSTSYTSTSLTVSVQLLATGDGTLTYSLYSGTLPSGLSLSSTGLISGTVTEDSTTTNLVFLVNDSENQTTQQTITLTITTTDSYWKNTTGLLQGDVVPFISDASTNAFTVTPAGDVRPYNFNPYTPGYYSNYFASNYISVANNTALNLSSGVWTIELWFFWDGTSAGYKSFISKRTGGSSEYEIGLTNTLSSPAVYFYNGALSTGGSVTSNVWHHLAAVYDGTNTKIYLDGSVVVTYAGTAVTGTASLYIGIDGTLTQAFPGYISNVRILKGTALYTTTFTPPTTPLTAIANTVLLTCQSNRFIDNSTNAFTVTPTSGPQIKSQHPFTPSSDYASYGSGYFDGTGDTLTVTSSTPNQFGSGDFTIETWYYCSGSISTASQQLFFRRTTASAIGMIFQVTSSKLNILAGDSNTSAWEVNISSSTTLVANTWYHFAVSRSGSTWKIFINGVEEGTATASFTIAEETANIVIGSSFTGYLSNWRAVKGTAVYTAAFTPPTSPLTAISGTSLLTLQTNLPHNNNTILDDSTNDFAITRSGSPVQGTFSPYSGYYSNYFDGTGDYLSIANSSVFNLTSDFTFECWIYNSSVVSGETHIFGKRASSAVYSQIIFGLNVSGGVNKMFVEGTTSSGSWNIAYTLGSITLPVGQWNHIAVVRSGTTIKSYVNGVADLTYTGVSGSFFTNTDAMTIGTSTANGSSGYYTGYISNFRFVNGLAVYTGAFTPPTTLLSATQSSGTNIATITGTSTSLLTCQSNRLIDNSTNAYTITKNGDTSVKPFGPFGRSAEYSIASNGGSIYYNGSSYTSFGSNSLFAFGTNDFTVECWFYLTSLGTGFNLFNVGGAATSSYSLYVYSSSGTKVQTARYGDTAGAGTTTQTFALNTWYHIAAVRSSGTAKIYVNGVADSGATYATMGTITATSAESGGRTFQGAVTGTGYISNLRVFPRTAQYTTTFTPPTAPVTAIQNTGLLIDGTSGAVIDGTQQTNLTTLADSRVLNTQYKYGNATTLVSGSYYFDGTGDYILTTPSTELEFGASDFTIEMWWYPTSTARQALYCGSFGTDYSIGIDYSSTVSNQKIGIWASSNGTSWNLVNADFGGNGVGTVTVNQNAWNHIAFVRYGTTWMSFVNGTRDRNITGLSGTIVDRSTAQKAIGSWFSTASMAQVTGYLDDIRITKGYARYVANFTVPSLAFKGK